MGDWKSKLFNILHNTKQSKRRGNRRRRKSNGKRNKKEKEATENIGTTLKFDAQHSRPQRAKSTADNTTTTFMTGSNKIIHQEHINKEQMIQQGKKRKAQDKATTDIGL